MKIFEEMGRYGFEQVVFANDEASGLRAIIAIHDTTLGPALGGCRMWPYPSEEEAIVDALRLARGMTYKNAAAGLDFGGGKSVIIGDPRKDKSEALFRAFGRFVDTLGGRYLTAEDVGVSVEDMEIVHTETDHVLGLSAAAGSSGDPSPVTAFGVVRGMKACALEVFGSDSLKDRTVVVQGAGHVGYNVVRYLTEEGAKVYVTDIYEDRVKKAADDFGAKPVAPDKVFDIECDVFCPCALGAVINDETLPKLKCKIVAGAANNQLKEERHGDALEDMGILYAPDYIINAGGVINVADEFYGYNRERALRKAAGIYENVLRVIGIAKRERIPTYKAAAWLAEERIAKLGRIHKVYVPA
ncbi:MAG: Glu/Leu/Phe/Val dehydrogenase [Firmicutes bacterium]|nr:Glu/Leu/Phe/Val dehydrogenase [Bacillota bacterium]